MPRVVALMGVANDLEGQERVSARREGSTKKYFGYSNDAFLRDMLTCIDKRNNGALFPTTGDFTFKEAYSINSRFFLRLISKTVKGVTSGLGGTGKDISEIGVELSNSMAGGHAVRLSWFVFRLC
jgi:hypothetical protein